MPRTRKKTAETLAQFINKNGDHANPSDISFSHLDDEGRADVLEMVAGLANKEYKVQDPTTIDGIRVTKITCGGTGK